MNRYSLTHIPDPALLRELRSLLAREHATTAELLAHLAEVDARRLYAPAGYPSMFAWCVEELHLSEDAAFARIRVARTAREFPALFALLADGQVHLTAVLMLAPYLTPQNAAGLFAAATHQSKAGIEQLLAERFPRPDLAPRIKAVAPRQQLAPERVKLGATELRLGQVESDDSCDEKLALERVKLGDTELAPGPLEPPVRSRVAPLAPGRYGLQFTVERTTYEKLRRAQALLGHAVTAGELAEVLDRALDALIGQLERRKFAATDQPRPRPRRPSANPRHIAAEVRRTVWQRDGGQCTFVSAAGHRCEARTRLEFDHVEPVARGGRATVNGMRLRCRAHNQYAAECAFSADFMSRKREAAQHAAHETRARALAGAEEARAAAAATEKARAHAAAAEEARIRAAAVEEVVPWLRALGLRADEARRRAACCETIPDAPLEERVRHALSCCARPARHSAAPPPQPTP